MQFSQMVTECRSIINEPDSTNSHFTNAQIKLWINEAYRFIMTKLDSIPIKERDYSAAETITLNSRTLTINTVRMDIQPQDEFVNLTVIDIDTLSRIDPDWENTPTGTPRWFVRMDTFTARLYPAPDASNTGATVRTHGLEFPADLSGDTDTPSLPLNLHDAFPHYAAYRALQQLNENEKAGSELSLVNGLLKSQFSISTKFSNKQNRWKFMEDDDYDTGVDTPHVHL